MKNYFKLAFFFFMGLLLVVGCKKETPAPTASFTATVNGGVVTFAANVTDATKYEWDFGDGSYINTLVAPVHTYAQLGTAQNIKVSLTIKGPGGQVTVENTLIIPAKSKLQYLTGGTADAPKSRKWRLMTSAPTFNINFATADFTPNYKSYPGGILAAVGLSAAYTDNFEFKSDGTMKINSVGGGIFAGYVYSMLNAQPNIGNAGGSGLTYIKPFTAPTAATFTINEGKNLTLTTSPTGAAASDVTYSNVLYLSFGGGGFFGIKDFTNEVIIKSLTDTQMVAICFVSAIPSGPYIGKPNFALEMYFEVVS